MTEKHDEIKQFIIDTFPEYHVSIGCMNNVKNVPELRKKLLGGELNCALLNSSLITDVFPVLLACNKAVSDHMDSSKKTRNIHSEILYNMSPSNSISGSLKTFGVTNDQTSFLCASVYKGGSEPNGVETVLKMADGTVTPLTTLEGSCQVEKIKELYKIGDEELTIGSLSDAVVMRIASKHII